MDLGIAGKRAIVCASSRGLGRGCALALAENGCELVINGRDRDALEETAEKLRGHGVKVTPIVADVSTPEGQRALLEACPEPDILVNNNAGPPFRAFQELDRKSMLDGVVQNMVTPIELVQAVIDRMMTRRFGRIVNITSSSVLMPIPGLDLSSGARAGLTAFLTGVAKQAARHNVTINNILPGKIATDRQRAILKWNAERAGVTPDEEAERQAAAIPAGRFGTPEEFGQVCAFLCSVHAGYITGRNILVDGGVVPTAF
jgi:3-oxoacyl-[acyl-carrier protein] reductase